MGRKYPTGYTPLLLSASNHLYGIASSKPLYEGGGMERAEQVQGLHIEFKESRREAPEGEEEKGHG